MCNTFFKLISLFLICAFINSCSTISDKLNIEEIINNTEEYFFGTDKENEEIEKSEIEADNTNKEDFPSISSVPETVPDFPQMDESFFEGEISISETANEDDIRKKQLEPKKVSSDTGQEKNSYSQKTILTIANISSSIRAKVKLLLAKSDPPTNPEATKISLRGSLVENDLNVQLTKIAIIQFPNNSVTPDDSAKEVLNKIVNKYKGSKLKLIGHASKTGSNSIQGKRINMEISFSRGEKIKEILVSRGFSKKQIIVEGMGDLEPVANTPTNSYNEAANRRVEIFYYIE